MISACCKSKFSPAAGLNSGILVTIPKKNPAMAGHNILNLSFICRAKGLKSRGFLYQFSRIFACGGPYFKKIACGDLKCDEFYIDIVTGLDTLSHSFAEPGHRTDHSDSSAIVSTDILCGWPLYNARPLAGEEAKLSHVYRDCFMYWVLSHTRLINEKPFLKIITILNH